MPEKRRSPSQSSPHQHTFAQDPQMAPSIRQRETSPSAHSAKALPQSLIAHLPFWEQPSFQNTVRSTNKLPSSPPPQRRETSSSSPTTQQRAVPSFSQQQKAPPSFSEPQSRQTIAPSQKSQYTQPSFPQPKKLHPLPSSKYIHPSPFNDIIEKYSLPNPVIIGKEGKFLYRPDSSISQSQMREKEKNCKDCSASNGNTPINDNLRSVLRKNEIVQLINEIKTFRKKIDSQKYAGINYGSSKGGNSGIDFEDLRAILLLLEAKLDELLTGWEFPCIEIIQYFSFITYYGYSADNPLLDSFASTNDLNLIYTYAEVPPTADNDTIYGGAVILIPGKCVETTADLLPKTGANYKPVTMALAYNFFENPPLPSYSNENLSFETSSFDNTLGNEPHIFATIDEQLYSRLVNEVLTQKIDHIDYKKIPSIKYRKAYGLDINFELHTWLPRGNCPSSYVEIKDIYIKDLDHTWEKTVAPDFRFPD